MFLAADAGQLAYLHYSHAPAEGPDPTSVEDVTLKAGACLRSTDIHTGRTKKHPLTMKSEKTYSSIRYRSSTGSVSSLFFGKKVLRPQVDCYMAE